MNNKNFHPILNEPPVAHALHKWNAETKTLSYEYNGRNVICLEFPDDCDLGYRHGSDGNIQTIPFVQQIYIMIDTPNKRSKAKVKFTLSNDTVNMRPNRAGAEQSILGQVGHPLMFGVNGIYDITQDLLIDWNGCDWEWLESSFAPNENGELTAELEVELGNKPWTINLRMHYYRSHLGYSYHKPWQWRPNTKPVAGWCSWEACRRTVSFEDITRFSKFFEEKLLDYGLEYIQLDDGYENQPIPFDSDKPLYKGWLDTNERFPFGHKGVVDVIKSRGFTPAIWTNANVTNRDFAEKNRNSFITDQNGDLMLGEWIDFVLDCSHETLQKHVFPYYNALSDYGYKYFKTDAIRHLNMDALHEAVRQGLMTNADAERRFRRFLEYARKGIGDDNYFLASWGVLSEAVGLVDACRIAMDANPTWAGIRMQLVESARWFHTQRILFVNDPDHICARTNIEWLKSIISLVSLSGSLLMLSDPIVDYDDTRIDIIRKNLPPLTTVSGETGPLDMTYPAFTWTKLHGFAVNSKEKPVEAENVSMEDAINMAGVYPTMNNQHPFSTLWSFHIDKGWRKWCVVGRFATVPLEECEIDLESLSLYPQKKYAVYDFWDQKYIGIVSGKIACRKLELGSCQILSFTEITDIPQMIASTRHVSMDAVSVSSISWNNSVLRTDIVGVKGTKESYIFYVPKRLSVSDITCNCNVEYEMLSEDILKISLDFSDTQAVLEIKFKD